MKTKFEIPLLKDHHNHPSVYAVLNRCINLENVKDKSHALSLIENSEDEITVALGWNSSYYYFEKRELDRLPPLFICEVSFHSFLMNEPARKDLEISYNELVNNIDDSIWVEKNLYLILKFIADIKECSKDVIQSFYEEKLLKEGVFYAEEMLLPNRKALESFKQAGFLERTRFWTDIDVFNSINEEDKKLVHGIKIFTDGALGSKTAAIRDPFTTGEKGISVHSDNSLFKTLDNLRRLNKPVSIHAIGDLATDQIVRSFTKLRGSGERIPEVRIEHSQFITRENAVKAKSLGIILSMQPNFNSDSVQYADRLNEKYCRNNNPFRMLIDEAGFEPGKDLIFGSDGMPHGVQYALAQSLFPAYPEQKLSIEEFIAGYCMDNTENGFIEVTVDEKNRKIETKVRT